jgi:hypothetical protein
MFWHLLLPQQREQLGRQLLCCPRRQVIAVFAKAGDRRQCRGKSHPQYKGTDCGRGVDHCYTPDVDLFYPCTRWLFVKQSTLGSKFRLCCSRAPTRRSTRGLIGCGCSQPLLTLCRWSPPSRQHITYEGTTDQCSRRWLIAVPTSQPSMRLPADHSTARRPGRNPALWCGSQRVIRRWAPLCGHQSRIVTGRLQLPAQVMCADAGFHANQAERHGGKACLDLAAWPLLPQYDRSALIEPDDAERVLADIDPQGGNGRI